MGRAVTKHLGDKTLAQRVAKEAAEPHLTPVWVQDAGRQVPGVLMAWESRNNSWWGLVVWDAGRSPERAWVPASRLQRVLPR
jgi:hypothetical protein